MSDILTGAKNVRSKAVSSRAAMAIVSRLIAGSILSLMFFQYFSSPSGSSAFVTSRLWWEIALNLQILSIGMMWFSYADRICPEQGPLRRLQLIKRWLAILAVSTPFVVGFIAVVNNWFTERPPPIVFGIIVGLALAHLIISLTVRLQIEKHRQHRQDYTAWWRLAFFAPSILFTFIAIACLRSGDLMWFSIAPLFLFIQGSMPYFMEVIGVVEPEAY